MIIVKLQGGLGNQMFQYAAARGLSAAGEIVRLDHRFLESNHFDTESFTARSYQLSLFKNIRARKAKNWETAFFFNQSFLNATVRRIFRSRIKIIQQYENELVEFNTSPKKHFFYLDGYFQSEKYFTNKRPELLQEFEFPELDKENESVEKKIQQAANPVSVHIRRGDYLKSPVTLAIHGVLSLEYYQKALDLLLGDFKDLTLFVFSDDMDWVKANFKYDRAPVYYIDQNHGEDSWKDMVLMSLCRHKILSNSSFSWWAAWISRNEGNVYVPGNWFNPKQVKFDIHDFIPASWIILT